MAVYLDAAAVIRWWHRNGTDASSYGLRGWQRGNVYPDFVFACLRSGSADRLVALETKGDQLAGNLDTEYKRQLLHALSEAYNSGAVASDGLPLPRDGPAFEAALILFSDWETKLPTLIEA